MRLSDLRRWWPIILGVVGVISAVAVFPIKLSAMEARQEKLEEQVSVIADFVELQQKIYDFKKAAPEGFYWDEIEEKYIPFEEDGNDGE